VTVFGPAEIEREVLSGRFDLGLGGIDSQTPHPDLSITPMRERRLFVAARPGHPLAGTRPTQAQLLRFPFVTVLLQGHQAHAAATGSGAGSADAARKGFVPAIEVNSLDTAKRIAEGSNALFPGSASMLEAHLSSGRLVTLDYDSPTLRTQPAIVCLRQRTLSPAALKFLQWVHEVETELISAQPASSATTALHPAGSHDRRQQGAAVKATRSPSRPS
jgi:DNA-binding transcriptional LysR family regulator